MSKRKRAVFIVVWVALMVVVLVAALVVGSSGESESIKVVMRDAVLHGTNKVSLFGIKDVNPAYISSLIVCGVLLLAAAVIRIFVIPRFKMVPGKFQMGSDRQRNRDCNLLPLQNCKHLQSLLPDLQSSIRGHLLRGI